MNIKSSQVLVEEARGTPILIKPHTITNMKIVESEVKKM